MTRTTLDLYQKYRLQQVVNASGTFTPLGVSRSPEQVCEAVSAALRNYFIIDELQQVASDAIAEYSGAEAAAVTHCAAAGITLSIAAVMAGGNAEAVNDLPHRPPSNNDVVIPGTHVVNYGHEITQDIRLCGAYPRIAGDLEHCDLNTLEAALSKDNIACLLLVSSRLVRDQSLDINIAMELAHQRNIPVIIDGAAQDMRITELLDSGADLVVCSAHKYLAAATAGLIIGNKHHVDAALAHNKGIGRAMKATKEAIIGVLAALEVRRQLNFEQWSESQNKKVADFVAVANRIDGITARTQMDPAGMPIKRVVLEVNAIGFGMTARQLSEKLVGMQPPIYVMNHELDNSNLVLEIQTLERHELTQILESIRDSGR